MQEISANEERLLFCGREHIEWARVDLVAGYIIMETAFSKSFGFSDTYCWWVSTVTELTRNPRNWLAILYLASTYSCLDARDIIYGLRGLMEFSDGGDLLEPDYSKSTLEVYRDSVEAAIVDYHSTDVFTYISGGESPSWIPQWNRPMLFRNPFRFGSALPRKPAGETTPIWKIDTKLNIISLSGFIVDVISFVESYSEKFFGNTMIEADEGRRLLRQVWQKILETVEKSQSQVPFNAGVFTALAISFSFGLDEKTDLADERYLLHNFVAYLRIVLDEETYNRYIPSNLSDEAKLANGRAFGKPVWDFDYPESNLFITENQFFGCTISTTRPGDLVCVPLGSTYPLILRPDGDEFLMRGYAYVSGLMHGALQNSERRIFRIR